ncbi:MAG: YfhO family protein [Polyangiales bacterium]
MNLRSPSRDVSLRALLSVCVIAPYWRLATMRGILATDDVIYSDILSAEFPARVEIGAMIRRGELPSWTNKLCGGYPLHESSAVADPLTLATFVPFSPTVALNLFVLATMLIVAHGTFSLARRLGASTAASMLSAIAMANSGYVSSQLKHLTLMATVCWIPTALVLLDHALGPELSTRTTEPRVARSSRARVRSLALFAAVFGLQWLAGFPQSAHLSGVTYGVFALARSWSRAREDRASSRLAAAHLAAAALAALLGLAIGAVALLPMHELGAHSARATGVSYDFATQFPFWPRDALMFVSPFANGQAIDATYFGKGIYWEDYGYVGLLPFALAMVALVRSARSGPRTREMRLVAALAVASFLVVLGPATPVFKVLFHTVPGMDRFRFPTRFLVVTDLMLTLLAGLGLTEVCESVERRWRRSWAISVVAVTVTLADLWWVQSRQNVIVDARAWLSPPKTAQVLAQTDAASGAVRIFSPNHIALHTAAFFAAPGWSRMDPYYRHREVLEPNTNLLYGFSTADCYAGLEPPAVTEMWGDHLTGGMLIDQTMHQEPDHLRVGRAFYRILAMHSVGYVVTPANMKQTHLELLNPLDDTHVYRVRAVLPRARFTPYGRTVASDEDAERQIVREGFEPTREVLLHDSDPRDSNAAKTMAPDAEPDVVVGPPRPRDEVSMVSDRAGDMRLRVKAPSQGWLVVGDTYYPGWEAQVDGVEVPIVRANLSQRAVHVDAGTHQVRMVYRPKPLRIGAIVSLLAWLAVGVGLWRTRERADIGGVGGVSSAA